MSCAVGEVTEGLENSIMGGSPGELSEELVTEEKRKKGLRMSCDVGEVTERLENSIMGGSPGELSEEVVM